MLEKSLYELSPGDYSFSSDQLGEVNLVLSEHDDHLKNTIILVQTGLVMNVNGVMAERTRRVRVSGVSFDAAFDGFNEADKAIIQNFAHDRVLRQGEVVQVSEPNSVTPNYGYFVSAAGE